MTPSPPERCVIVVDQALPPGLAGNAAAVLALSVGAHFPQMPGQDLVDADGSTHPGLIPMGLPVLAGSVDQLTQLRATALATDLYVLDFPAAGQQTTDYDDFAAQVARTSTSDLVYLGVALCGSARRIRRLTGGFSLLR